MLTDAGHTVGRVLAGLCTTLNPSMIVVGGSLGTSATLVEAIRDGVDRYAHPEAAASVAVVPGHFGGRAEIMGVARPGDQPRRRPRLTLPICRSSATTLERRLLACGARTTRTPGSGGGAEGDAGPGAPRPPGLGDLGEVGRAERDPAEPGGRRGDHPRLGRRQYVGVAERADA